jgi:signal transduction histidine kinase
MAGLIDDVLDFARGRLGGGIPVERVADVPLGPLLQQVVGELQVSRPERVIEIEVQGVESFYCDPNRIGQMLSNLVANALTHGSASGPIRVQATTTSQALELSVSNPGEPIPPHMLEHLFKPFVRAAARPNQQGLGLGLYIAAEIARAHGGEITVHSDRERTTFNIQILQALGPMQHR